MSALDSGQHRSVEYVSVDLLVTGREPAHINPNDPHGAHQ